MRGARTKLASTGAALGMALLAAGTLPDPARAQSDIEVYCSVSALESECVFTNVGSSAGTTCVRVVLTNPETAEEVRSQTVCSGKVEGSSTVTQPVGFLGDTSACVPASQCEMEIETVSYDDTESETVAGWLEIGGGFLLLLVLGSTIWVGVDAHRLGMAGPWNWILMTALLWIIGFPWYLLERSRELARRSERREPAPPRGAEAGMAGSSSLPGGVWSCGACGAMNDSDRATCADCSRSR